MYWFTYSAQLKLCIDRWYGLFQNEPHLFQGRQVGLLLVYGDEDLYISGGINAVQTVETTCRYLEAHFAGVVHGSMSDPGDAEKRPDLLEEAYRLGMKLAVDDRS